MTLPSPTPASSPCIGVCRIDDDGYCQGCWRSLNEIAAWASLSEQQRQEIMQYLPERGRQLRLQGQ